MDWEVTLNNSNIHKPIHTHNLTKQNPYIHSTINTRTHIHIFKTHIDTNPYINTATH